MSKPSRSNPYAVAFAADEQRATLRLRLWLLATLLGHLALYAPAPLRMAAALALVPTSALVLASLSSAIHRLRTVLGEPGARWWKAPASRVAAFACIYAAVFVGGTVASAVRGQWMLTAVGAAGALTLGVAVPYYELRNRCRSLAGN